MDKAEKLKNYYEKEHPFKDGINLLRSMAMETESTEDFKWNFPVYTLNGKNVFGICRFKNHFGLWFFNGSFLSDPKKVLQNAQEGKTKGMRHWKFQSADELDRSAIREYLLESIENQKQGKEISVEKGSKSKMPELLKAELDKNPSLKSGFETFPPYKQKEFCEYILEAKQERTKLKRLEKILPMIEKGVGLNDAYR